MATGFAEAEANAALDALAIQYTWVKLHVGDPGAAGTSFPAGETDRVQATWSAVADGVLTNSNTLTWPAVSTAEDYTHFSVWTLSAAGTFGFSGTVTANAISVGDDFVVAPGQLTFTLNVAA